MTIEEFNPFYEKIKDEFFTAFATAKQPPKKNYQKITLNEVIEEELEGSIESVAEEECEKDIKSGGEEELKGEVLKNNRLLISMAAAGAVNKNCVDETDK